MPTEVNVLRHAVHLGLSAICLPPPRETTLCCFIAFQAGHRCISATHLFIGLNSICTVCNGILHHHSEDKRICVCKPWRVMLKVQKCELMGFLNVVSTLSLFSCFPGSTRWEYNGLCLTIIGVIMNGCARGKRGAQTKKGRQEVPFTTKCHF